MNTVSTVLQYFYYHNYDYYTNYKVRGACAPLLFFESESTKTLVNAIDCAGRLQHRLWDKNISLGSVVKLLLASHFAVVSAALFAFRSRLQNLTASLQSFFLPELLS